MWLAWTRTFCIAPWLCMETLGLRAAKRATEVTNMMTRLPYPDAVGVRAETLVAVGYTRALRPDKLRPCNHWCGGQPVDETGSGQARGDEWWRRSGWAMTLLSRVDSSVLTGSGQRHCLSCRRASHVQTPLATPTSGRAPLCEPSRR